MNKDDIGKISWIDLTVPNAEETKDFYKQVVGWQSEPVTMGKYEDYNMKLPGSGETVTGICHARGVNADMPAQWLIYITVEDVYKSCELCTHNGGEVLVEPKKMGSFGDFAVIRDPAGAVAALFTPKNQY